jgi:hypothetical protein
MNGIFLTEYLAPDDKWVKIVENGAESTERQALKTQAEEWLKNKKH